LRPLPTLNVFVVRSRMQLPNSILFSPPDSHFSGGKLNLKCPSPEQRRSMSACFVNFALESL
jgi:hypothetical protein